MIADQKQTERLIKAVMALEQRFKRAEERGPSTVKDFAKQKLKEVFSTENMLDKIGLGKGTLIGSFLSIRRQNKEEEKERKAIEAGKAREFATGFKQYTDRGRSLSKIDENKALKIGVELYEKHKNITQQIAQIEKKREDAKKLGSGADISKEDKEYLGQLYQDKENIFKDPTMTPQMNRIKKTILKKGRVIPQAIRKFEEENKEKMTNEVRGEFAASIKSGIDEELLSLNQKQLDALDRMVELSEETEEERLESNIKGSPISIKKKEETKEKKDTSLLETLFNLTGLMKNLAPAVASLATVVAPLLAKLAAFALPGLGIAAAGAVGYVAGDKLVNPLLNKATQAVTGDKTATVGTGFYAANNALKSLYGQSDEQKMAKKETKDRISLGLDKIVKGESISSSMKTFLDSSVESMTEDQKNIYYNNIRNANVVGQISKPSITTREIQNNQLEAVREQTRSIMQENAEAPVSSSASVTNNNVNNLTKITQITPPVRNFDLSYNDRLRATFA
jgi:hypothetical protein